MTIRIHNTSQAISANSATVEAILRRERQEHGDKIFSIQEVDENGIVLRESQRMTYFQALEFERQNKFPDAS